MPAQQSRKEKWNYNKITNEKNKRVRCYKWKEQKSVMGRWLFNTKYQWEKALHGSVTLNNKIIIIIISAFKNQSQDEREVEVDIENAYNIWVGWDNEMKQKGWTHERWLQKDSPISRKTSSCNYNKGPFFSFVFLLPLVGGGFKPSEKRDNFYTNIKKRLLCFFCVFVDFGNHSKGSK